MSGTPKDSILGDVIWADGKAWMRQGNFRLGYVRGPWRSYSANAEMAVATTSDLRQYDDFTWLVRAGIPVIVDELHDLRAHLLKLGRQRRR